MAERLDRVVVGLAEIFLDAEQSYRTMLRLSLENDASGRSELALRLIGPKPRPRFLYLTRQRTVRRHKSDPLCLVRLFADEGSTAFRLL